MKREYWTCMSHSKLWSRWSPTIKTRVEKVISSTSSWHKLSTTLSSIIHPRSPRKEPLLRFSGRNGEKIKAIALCSRKCRLTRLITASSNDPRVLSRALESHWFLKMLTTRTSWLLDSQPLSITRFKTTKSKIWRCSLSSCTDQHRTVSRPSN